MMHTCTLEDMSRDDLLDLIKIKELQISRLKAWRRAVLAQLGIKGRMSQPNGACVAILALQNRVRKGAAVQEPTDLEKVKALLDELNIDYEQRHEDDKDNLATIPMPYISLWTVMQDVEWQFTVKGKHVDLQGWGYL